MLCITSLALIRLIIRTLHLCLPPPDPLSLVSPSLISFSMNLFFVLFSESKQDHTIFVFLCLLISLNPSKSIHIISNYGHYNVYTTNSIIITIPQNVIFIIYNDVNIIIINNSQDTSLKLSLT